MLQSPNFTNTHQTQNQHFFYDQFPSFQFKFKRDTCDLKSRGLDLHPEDTFQALSELTTAPDTADHSHGPTTIFPLVSIPPLSQFSICLCSGSFCFFCGLFPFRCPVMLVCTKFQPRLSSHSTHSSQAIPHTPLLLLSTC